MAKYKIIYHRPKEEVPESQELWQVPPGRRAKHDLDMEEIAKINASFEEEGKDGDGSHLPKKRSFWRSPFWPTLVVVGFIIWTLATVFTPLTWPDIGFLKSSSRLAQDPSLAVLKSAVVLVEVPGKSGSGFNIDAGGLVITNKHVVGDADTCNISFPDGSSYLGQVMYKMADYDIALIDITGKNLPFVSLAKEDAQKGDPLVFVGNPMGFDWTISEATCMGVIPRGSNDLQVMYLKGPVRPGSSGSPVYNSNDEVVGVVYASLTNQEDVGLAIPVSVLKQLIDQLLTSQ